MSLLLLFKPGTLGWIKQSLSVSTWTLAPGDFKHLWKDWNTTTWGFFKSNGFAWTYMQGLTFTKSSNQATTWNIQPPAS